MIYIYLSCFFPQKRLAETLLVVHVFAWGGSQIKRALKQ